MKLKNNGVLFGLIFSFCINTIFVFLALENTYDAYIHLFLAATMQKIGLIPGAANGTQDFLYFLTHH